MKKSGKSKVLAILMTLTMVFTMMPMMGAAVYADDPNPPAPGIAQGPDVLGVGSNTSGAATVHMAGTEWRVIGYAGDGVASTKKDPEKPGSADTMTLIAANNLKTDVQFRADWQTAGAHNYGKNANDEDSNLKNEIETLTDGDNGIFSAGETAGIVDRNLDGIAGNAVSNALLWPLSTEEANKMNSELRNANNDPWWLRSPGDYNDYAALVHEDGTVYGVGDYVDEGFFGVRPAFNFNLESVIFTSAAAGGKLSGAVGAGALQPVESNSTNEWKLTVKDKAHKDFKVDSVSTCDGKTLTIKYSKAAAGDGEYISAIIVSPGGEVKYYGKLAPASKQDGATTKVDIEGKMESDDTLYVFNEQCNDDYETDFSSSLQATTKTADHAWDQGKVTKAPTVTTTGIRTYTCTVCKATKTETIPKLAKKANSLKVKGKTATVKYSKLKKKAQTIKLSKAVKFKAKGQGKLSYKKGSVSYTKAKSIKLSKKALKKYRKTATKKIEVNAKTGKITLKKGLKKGTYKVKVKVKAAGNANYKPSAWKTVSVKITVK